ncbi:leucine-rich repeat domain-containing protein [Flaviramulus basaltis]|nr:leucine-rich repeat domain-containing protein [Flaviramulus basaltis]
MKTKLFLLFAILNLSIASAQTFTVNGVKYDIIPTTTNVEVVSNSPQYTGAVTIPSTVEYNAVTYAVTSIKQQAFFNCLGLTSVTIGNSVTTIGIDAFQQSSNLTSVTMGNSVTTIERRAFSDCTSLTSITISNSVTSIEDYTFDNCTGLTSVTIGNSVTSIGEFAFSDCTSLTSITIPNSVTYIDNYAFLNCSSVTTLTIPALVWHIGGGAFSGCTSLTTVNCAIVTPIYIPANVFGGVTAQSTCALNIPPASVNAYKAAAVWKDFNPINGTLSNESFVNKNKIKLYPNPVSNNLTIENPFADNRQLKVINQLGQIVLKQNTSSISLDVSALSKGLYFLKVTLDNGNSQTIKFLKK